MKVEIVSATRLAEQDFWQKSALGQSLRVHRLDERVVVGEVIRPNSAFLSGTVGQGSWPPGLANHWGPAPAEVEFLDGFFIAARKVALRRQTVRFDPQFDFHFYDMDFCSSAREKGLRLGTWRINLTHQSVGDYDNDACRAKSVDYLKKWGAVSSAAHQKA